MFRRITGDQSSGIGIDEPTLFWFVFSEVDLSIGSTMNDKGWSIRVQVANYLI